MTQKGIEPLLEYLALYGGKIVSSASLSHEWIEQARVSGRMYVDENHLGYVWEPDFKNGIPETEKEVELFEWCYPLPVKLPLYFEIPFFLSKGKQSKN